MSKLEAKTKFYFYEGDWPDNLDLGDEVAIDTEAMGLNNQRDRLCLVQLAGRDGVGHMVRFQPNQYKKG